MSGSARFSQARYDDEGFIDEIVLSDAALQLARSRYSRRSIFQRVCARTIAERRRQADLATSRGEHDRAQAIWEEILGFEPGSASHRLRLAESLSEGGQHARALAEIEDLLTWELPPAQLAQITELKGDLLWKSDQRQRASDAYVASLGAGLSDAARRRLTVKKMATDGEKTEVTALARQYMLDELPRSKALYTVMRWAELAPGDPLPRYLTGLLLSAMEEPAEAARWLADGPLPAPALEQQRQLLLADALRLSGQLDAAAEGYTALLSADSHRVVRRAELGLERTAWRRTL